MLGVKSLVSESHRPGSSKIKVTLGRKSRIRRRHILHFFDVSGDDSAETVLQQLKQSVFSGEQIALSLCTLPQRLFQRVVFAGMVLSQTFVQSHIKFSER